MQVNSTQSIKWIFVKRRQATKNYKEIFIYVQLFSFFSIHDIIIILGDDVMEIREIEEKIISLENKVQEFWRLL